MNNITKQQIEDTVDKITKNIINDIPELILQFEEAVNDIHNGTDIDCRILSATYASITASKEIIKESLKELILE